MKVLEYLITYPNDQLSLAIKGAIEQAVKRERIAKTLSWWVPL